MKSVLITRPRAQAEPMAAALKAAGFEPVIFPVIEIRPVADGAALKRAQARLACYDWLIFTSTNAVDLFWRSPAGQAGLPENLRVAAVGPKTAAALRTHGVEPAFIPEEFVAEAILPGLGDLRGRMLLLPCAELAGKELPFAISEAGGVAHCIAVYRTLPSEADPAGLAALRNGVTAITLTSPSTVENFITLARRNGLDPLALPGLPAYACIGPVTGLAANRAGLPNLIVAHQYTTAGLLEAIHFLL